jgi:hypothetical protein
VDPSRYSVTLLIMCILSLTASWVFAKKLTYAKHRSNMQLLNCWAYASFIRAHVLQRCSKTLFTLVLVLFLCSRVVLDFLSSVPCYTCLTTCLSADSTCVTRRDDWLPSSCVRCRTIQTFPWFPRDGIPGHQVEKTFGLVLHTILFTPRGTSTLFVWIFKTIHE